jgi:hypothetical protein
MKEMLQESNKIWKFYEYLFLKIFQNVYLIMYIQNRFCTVQVFSQGLCSMELFSYGFNAYEGSTGFVRWKMRWFPKDRSINQHNGLKRLVQMLNLFIRTFSRHWAVKNIRQTQDFKYSKRLIPSPRTLLHHKHTQAVCLSDIRADYGQT